MKKSCLLLLISLIANTIVFSQDYRCFQTGVKHYFNNSKGYLRGIRIDSVEVYADSTVYYPYHSIRGSYSHVPGLLPVDSAGGSWLGKRIVGYSDGTFLFDNIWHDTVIIRTQATIGDNWILYRDTSDVYYKAYMVSKTTRVIDGVVDSVKTMVVRAFNRDTGYIPSDPASELKIAISKNHGLYQAFDLYLFPHRYVCPTPYCDTASGLLNDYFFKECGDQQFNYVEAPHILKEDMFDYNIGDIFEYHTYCVGMCIRFVIDTIVSKTAISSTETKYEIHERTYAESGHPTKYSYGYTTKALTINSGVWNFIPDSLMPEEVGISSLYTYFPGDDYCGFTSPYIKIATGMLFNDFQPCGNTDTYKVGYGKIANIECYDPTPPNSSSSKMIYAFKSGVHCGTFWNLPTEIKNVQPIEEAVMLSPNPANSSVAIATAMSKKYTVSLTDISGRQVFTREYHQSNISINTRDFASSFYIVSIADAAGNRIFKKLQINH